MMWYNLVYWGPDGPPGISLFDFLILFWKLDKSIYWTYAEQLFVAVVASTVHNTLAKRYN